MLKRTPFMSRLGRKIWKWFAATLAALLILLAIGVGLFRVAVPMVPGLRADAEIIAQQAIGWPVRIGEIDLQWALLGPELVLTDVQLLAPDTYRPLVTARRLDIVFGPLDLFQQGTPRPSHIRLHEPTLALERDADGELFLSGFALPATTGTRLDWREFLDFALRHGRVTIIDGELHYRDATLDIDDWLLRLPEFSVASDGNEHEFSGSFLPPGALGEEIAVGFTATGKPATPEEWLWKLDMAVRAMKLDWWYQQFRWSEDAQLHGTLDLGLLVSGRGLQGMTGAGQLALKDLGFTPRAPAMTGETTDPFERIALDWEFDYGNGRLALDVSELQIITPREEFTDGSFAMLSGGDIWPLEIAAARLPLAVLAKLAQFLPSELRAEQETLPLADVRRRIAQLAPRGDLRELVLGVNLDTDPVSFRLETRFERLGIAPYESLPGFSGLSGTLRSDENSGRLQLASEDVVVDTDGLFRTPLPVEKLQGKFTWQRQDDGWRVRGTDIAVENPEVSATAELSLELPAEGSPFIDLTATAFNADFDARSTWLPAAAMPERLVEWLDTAILDGHAPEAKLVLRGPLQNYPFRDGSGVFDVKFRAEDTAVKFAPDWPQVRDLSAAVHFHNAALDIVVDRAMVAGIDVGRARVGYADSRDGMLEVDADVDTDMAKAWQFLAATPLSEPLSGMLNALDVSGPMHARVALAIPTENVSDTTATVAASLHEIHVQPTAVPWAIEALSGDVNVTEQKVAADSLTGRFTGAPFTASITSEAPADGDTFAPVRVAMQGHSPVTAFETFLPDAWLQALDGSFDWDGVLRVPGDGSGVAMNFSSVLAGVNSDLPAPLDALPRLEAAITIPPAASRIDVQLQADRLGAGHLRFVELPSGWSFDRGQVVMGALPEVTLGNESGLHISGEVQRLDANGWLSRDDDGAAGGNVFLRGIDIAAEQLELGAITLPSQRVSASRAGAGWDVALSGPARGVLHVPSLLEASEPWQVRLEQLHLPAPDAVPGAVERAAPDPRTLPALDLNILDLKVGMVELGHVSGVLQRTSIGYNTQNLVARTGSYRLALDGRWELVNDQHYTSITAVLDSSDVGASLDQLGYRGGLDADEGRVEANLAWHAAPTHVERGLLEGNAQILFRDGSLSEVSPGAGRLLGLLSIAALPRRLTLDFSDFFGEGLHFDSLGGDFLITGGSAYTTNVVLDGPSVSALLVGRTGLVARDYDQLVIVDPDVSASIPVAGYLAAGPTVGAALLLLSQLLKAPLADMTQVKYRITGSWDEPVIERVQQERNVPE